MFQRNCRNILLVFTVGLLVKYRPKTFYHGIYVCFVQPCLLCPLQRAVVHGYDNCCKQRHR